ncbi:MAG: hypothetical protein K1Y36_24515 [Blastocatellia bacterium]|nr:hypothetical protein [Blastocatellia bacterium]
MHNPTEPPILGKILATPQNGNDLLFFFNRQTNEITRRLKIDNCWTDLISIPSNPDEFQTVEAWFAEQAGLPETSQTNFSGVLRSNKEGHQFCGWPTQLSSMETTTFLFGVRFKAKERDGNEGN